MFKKLIIGTLATGIMISGGVSASASTLSSENNTNSTISPFQKSVSRTDVVNGVVNLYIGSGQSEWVTPKFYLESNLKVNFHGWQEASANNKRADVTYQLIDTSTGVAVSSIRQQGDFKSNGTWFHSLFTMSRVTVPKYYRVKAVNNLSDSGVNIGGDLYIDYP